MERQSLPSTLLSTARHRNLGVLEVVMLGILGIRDACRAKEAINQTQGSSVLASLTGYCVCFVQCGCRFTRDWYLGCTAFSMRSELLRLLPATLNDTPSLLVFRQPAIASDQDRWYCAKYIEQPHNHLHGTFSPRKPTFQRAHKRHGDPHTLQSNQLACQTESLVVEHLRKVS